jgi:hypothetical protein
LKTRGLQLASLVICSISWVSCATGFKPNVCISDTQNNGFQCAKEGEQGGSFLTYLQGKDLVCISPGDTELYLKACKAYTVKKVTECTFDVINFICTDPTGNQFRLLPADAENYFCLSHKDKLRLEQRCI